MTPTEELEPTLDGLNKEVEELKERAEELEVGHYAQEQRLLHIWYNALTAGKLGEKQRKAALLNLIWNILPLNSNGRVLGLPLLSLATLAIAIYANVLLQDQNKKVEQQTYLLEADRRSSLVHLFSNVMDAVDKELKAKK